mgnify:CR=1 FL=1
MIWESWRDFFAMGGYALYVWGSFIVVFGCMAGEVLLVTQRSKSIRAQLIRASNALRTRSQQ